MKMRAFWSYDLFPYCLSGEVIKIDNEGYVHVKGYEGYARFRPLVILPDKRGTEVQADIEQIKQEYRKKKDALHEEYMSKLRKVAPWMTRG